MGRAIDIGLERLAIASLRRRRPLLRLVPARWIRPAVKPTVMRLRRSLARAGLAAAAVAGVITTLVILQP